MAARPVSRRKLLPEAAGASSPLLSPRRDQGSQQQEELVSQPSAQTNEKSLPFRTTNPSPDSHPAPSYYDETHSRRMSTHTARSLPPYPSSPPVVTGWAALSDTKYAAARGSPPQYPEPDRRAYLATPASSPPSLRGRSISTASSSLSSLPSIGDPGPYYRPSISDGHDRSTLR